MRKARPAWNGPLTLDERTRLLAIRALMRLPAAVQVRLSGRPPVTHGQDVLHPELQLLIALVEKLGQAGLTDVPAVVKRQAMRREAFVYARGEIRVGKVEDLTVPVPHGGLAARHYAPVGVGKKRPLLVFFHGGGFSVGDLETHDAPCRLICRDAGVHVLSVDYRLAPEFPFPAAHEDAAAAYQWAAENALLFGADPRNVGIGGDSAGGNLAAVVVQDRAAAGLSQPSLQLLIYPVVDGVTSYKSRAAFADGFLLTAKDIKCFAERFAPGHDPADLRLSPLLAPNLGKLSPAIVVTAAFDPLRDEGEAYAAALQAGGTKTQLLRMPGLTHGFINLTGLSPACWKATELVAAAVKKHWEDI